MPFVENPRPVRRVPPHARAGDAPPAGRRRPRLVIVTAHGMVPQFVYFDLGNVVCSFDRERAIRQMAALTGTTPDRVRSEVIDGGLQAALERGAIDWLEFHERFSERTGTSSDAEALATAASDMFALNVDLLPVIAGLERAGCRAGILSNTCDAHWRHLVASGYAILPGGFAPIVLSHEVGAIKPDPAIFASAAARAGVAPDRIFFCDDIEEHVAAARRAGWDSEPYVSASRLVDDLARRGLELGL